MLLWSAGFIFGGCLFVLCSTATITRIDMADGVPNLERFRVSCEHLLGSVVRVQHLDHTLDVLAAPRRVVLTRRDSFNIPVGVVERKKRSP